MTLLQKLIENPLSFNHIAISLDLGNNGLGHYIVFESGFLGYSYQTSSLLGGANKKEEKLFKIK